MCLEYSVSVSKHNNPFLCGIYILVGSCERLEHETIMKPATALQRCQAMMNL